MADRLRQDAGAAGRHEDQPHVRMGCGQPRGRLPDRHQQPAGHIHRDGRVPGHAHRSHGAVRSHVNRPPLTRTPPFRRPRFPRPAILFRRRVFLFLCFFFLRYPTQKRKRKNDDESRSRPKQKGVKPKRAKRFPPGPFLARRTILLLFSPTVLKQ